MFSSLYTSLARVLDEGYTSKSKFSQIFVKNLTIDVHLADFNASLLGRMKIPARRMKQKPGPEQRVGLGPTPVE